MCADEKKNIYIKPEKKVIKKQNKKKKFAERRPTQVYNIVYRYCVCVFYTLEVIINNAVSTTAAAVNNETRRVPHPVPTQYYIVVCVRFNIMSYNV